MSKGSDILVKALENEGVEFVFGLPGEENLDFLKSLRTSSIKVMVTRHEQAAAFMAATYGRLTGKPGVCFSTLGPGATNLVTGAAYALLGGMPMLMITGQKPILQSRQARFQIIDTVGMMQPLTKMAKQIIDAVTSRRWSVTPSGSPRKSVPARCSGVAGGHCGAGGGPLRTGPGLGVSSSDCARRRNRHRGRRDRRETSAGNDRRRREPARPVSRCFRRPFAIWASRFSTRRWVRARSTASASVPRHGRAFRE